MIRVLAISGSLRKTSSNTAILKASSTLAEQMNVGIKIDLFDSADLENIPHFNPDKDVDGLIHDAVIRFRSKLSMANAIIISSPEYAGGIAGAIKNSLDWVVSTGLIVYQKPFVLINTSARATKAYEDLKVIVSTMGGIIVETLCHRIVLPNSNITQEQILANEKLSDALRGVIDKLRYFFELEKVS